MLPISPSTPCIDHTLVCSMTTRSDAKSTFLAFLLSSISTCASDVYDLVFRRTPAWTPAQLFERRPKRSSADIPNAGRESDDRENGERHCPPSMRGKVVLITGGHSGCGLECVRWMAQGVKRIYLLGRSISAMKASIEKLKNEVGMERWLADILYIECHLANLDAVQNAAKQFFLMEALRLEAESLNLPAPSVGLDLLFLNAGIYTHKPDTKTEDGFDLMWGVNCLAHHALLRYLMPALKDSARAARTSANDARLDGGSNQRFVDRSPRVLWTGSIAHTWLVSPAKSYYPLEVKLRSWNPAGPYARSKASNLLDMYYCLPTLTKAGIVGTVVHPGVLYTPIQREFERDWQQRGIAALLAPQSLGCVNLLWTAFVASAEEVHGGYVTQWCRMGKVTKMVRDKELIRRHGEFMDQIVDGIFQSAEEPSHKQSFHNGKVPDEQVEWKEVVRRRKTPSK